MPGRGRAWWRTWRGFFVLRVEGYRQGGDESCGESSGFHRGQQVTAMNSTRLV